MDFPDSKRSNHTDSLLLQRLMALPSYVLHELDPLDDNTDVRGHLLPAALEQELVP